jgi:hypothetical protein
VAALLSGDVADAGDEFGGEAAVGVAQGGVGAWFSDDRSSEGGVLGADAAGDESLERGEGAAGEVVEESAADAGVCRDDGRDEAEGV